MEEIDQISGVLGFGEEKGFRVLDYNGVGGIGSRNVIGLDS